MSSPPTKERWLLLRSGWGHRRQLGLVAKDVFSGCGHRVRRVQAPGWRCHRGHESPAPLRPARRLTPPCRTSAPQRLNAHASLSKRLYRALRRARSKALCGHTDDALRFVTGTLSRDLCFVSLVPVSASYSTCCPVALGRIVAGPGLQVSGRRRR